MARRKRTKRIQEAQWIEQEDVPRQPFEDPRVVVLDARCRHNAKCRHEDVADDMWGDMVGRAIVIGAEGLTDRRQDERREVAARLWSLFKRLDAVEEAYFQRIIGKARFPNVSKMEYIPEPFETRPDDRPREYRTEEAKDAAAKHDWIRWRGYLVEMTEAEHCSIASALRHRLLLSHAGKLTGAGDRFFAAMLKLAELERLDTRKRA